MNHIPVEVLNEIFTKLDLKTRLKCMLVCRFWYDTLDRFTLLCSQSVKNNQVSKFMDMVTRFPHRAIQVEHLDVNDRLGYDVAKGELCSMFPNLREISFNRYSGRKPHIDKIKPFQISHTTCKLEKIKDFANCELAPQLAMSNLCDNLKTLVLDHENFGLSATNTMFILELKNMPVLEDLSMKTIKFKLIDLEIMHSNLPSLKRLHIDSARPMSGEIPRDVVPASLITELNVKVGLTENGDALIQYYSYIGNKYLSVSKLILEDEGEINRYDQDVTRRIYNEGIFPLYQNIGSQVDTFIFNDYFNGLGAFRKFDDYEMKLKDLTINLSRICDGVKFIEELAQSQQSNYVQKLVLWNIIPESVHMISHLEVLDTLEIHSASFFEGRDILRTEINFTQLIDACPATLTTLYMNNINLTLDGPTSNITSIKYLDIINVKMSPILAKIIETSFPNLSTLNISCDITSNVTIPLLEHKLKQVDITAIYNEGENPKDYTIDSKCEDGIQSHIIKRTPNSYNRGRLYAYDGRSNPLVKIEPKKSFALKFICPSVERLFFSVEEK